MKPPCLSICRIKPESDEKSVSTTWQATEANCSEMLTIHKHVQWSMKIMQPSTNNPAELVPGYNVLTRDWPGSESLDRWRDSIRPAAKLADPLWYGDHLGSVPHCITSVVFLSGACVQKTEGIALCSVWLDSMSFGSQEATSWLAFKLCIYIANVHTYWWTAWRA